tara:strand:- start:2603 stop:3100 length:498 start_codon:yes stop_codon:yes gene_type:complete
MSKLFKKAGEVELINGGYVSDAEGKPVTNVAFIDAQVRAHRLVTIAAAMEGKNFVANKVDSIDALVRGVDAKLNATTVQTFVEVPSIKKGKITLGLEKEALSFMQADEEAQDANRINKNMQEFCVISEFENHGLFFKAGVSKLEKIYSIEEILVAAETVYAVLAN